jgi:excisionase family DNA binding protein
MDEMELQWNPTESPIPRLALKPAEAAEALGICKRTLDQLVKDDLSFPCVRVGSRRLIPLERLRQWLSDRVEENGQANTSKATERN